MVILTAIMDTRFHLINGLCRLVTDNPVRHDESVGSEEDALFILKENCVKMTRYLCHFYTIIYILQNQ